MKKTLFTLLTIFSAFNLFAQSKFEGVITMHSESRGGKDLSDITWYVKNGQHRIDYVNSGEMSSTYSLLSKAGKLEMLNERGRVNIPGNSMKQPDYNFNAYKLVSTKAGEEINGFPCTKYTIEQGDKVAEYWIVQDPTLQISDFPEFMRHSLLSVSEKLQPGSIPIQIKISDLNGKMVYMQAIKDIISVEVGEEKFR